MTIAQGYSGIFNGAAALDAFINSYHFAPGEKLNIIVHSHGGNVVLIAASGLKHEIDNLVTLGTPVNWDLLPSESTSNIQNFCAVSSSTDYVQFAGASPAQIAGFGVSAYYATEYARWATEAILDGDYLDAFIYGDEAVAAGFTADAFWFSTKIMPDANNVVLTGYDHSDLHTPGVWDQITKPCGLSH